jgi:hypothetical protein
MHAYYEQRRPGPYSLTGVEHTYRRALRLGVVVGLVAIMAGLTTVGVVATSG